MLSWARGRSHPRERGGARELHSRDHQVGVGDDAVAVEFHRVRHGLAARGVRVRPDFIRVDRLLGKRVAHERFDVGAGEAGEVQPAPCESGLDAAWPSNTRPAAAISAGLGVRFQWCLRSSSSSPDMSCEAARIRSAGGSVATCGGATVLWWAGMVVGGCVGFILGDEFAPFVAPLFSSLLHPASRISAPAVTNTAVKIVFMSVLLRKSQLERAAIGYVGFYRQRGGFF